MLLDSSREATIYSKPGNRHDWANYRLICLTSVVGKLLEAVVSVRINDTSETHKMFSDMQFCLDEADPAHSLDIPVWKLSRPELAKGKTPRVLSGLKQRYSRNSSR